MFIHFYNSLVPNSGDIRRIKNINKEFSENFGTQAVEVSFYGLKDRSVIRKWGKFKVNDNSAKKLYILTPPKVKLYFPWYFSLVLAIVGLIYHVDFAVGEMVLPYKFKEIFRWLNCGKKIFVDIHGARVEELISVQPNTPQEIVEKERYRELYSVESANAVVCQSDEMKRYIMSKYGQSPEKIVVYRCGYEQTLFNVDPSQRQEKRTELGLTDDNLLFVYAGGLHKWQKIEESLNVFKSFRENTPNAKFLILTGDQSRLGELLNSERYAEIKSSVISFSVPFASVAQYLNAADVAFLIRDNHPMNAVASPTKLAEYLACGLPIITSEVAKCWVDESCLPYLVLVDDGNINDDISEIIKSIDKKAVEEYAISHLSLEIDRSNIKKYLGEKWSQ